MSKGLETLKDIYCVPVLNHLLRFPNDEENLKRKINVIEKELKAFEIIKKYGHFDFYTGELIVNIPNDKQEEYNLLKEVLL